MTWRTPLATHGLSVRSTRGSLGTLVAAGAGIVLLAVACTVTSGSDGDPGPGTPGSGGMGGEDNGTGGSTTNTGGTTTGTGGDGGAMGAQLDCHDGDVVSGTPASTEPDAGDDECWACIKEECPDEFADCHAVEPNSVCGYDDAETLGGEIECIFECFDALAATMPPTFVAIQEDLDDCVEQCGGTASCGSSEPTAVTVNLAACTIGLADDESTACSEACGWL